MALQPSTAQAALAERLEQLPPDSPRYEVVQAARKFKDSWVELAQHLTTVRRQHAYKAWGFASFANYCRTELHLKQETADKLTRSYGYLQERVPSVLEASPEAYKALPPLDVVDLLSQAKARTTVSSQAWDALEGEVLEGDGVPSRAALRKRIKEVDPQALTAPSPAAKAAAPVAALPVDAHNLRKVLLLAERVEQLLTAMTDGIDASTLQGAKAVADALRSKVQLAQAAMAAGHAPGQLPSDARMH